MSVRAKYQDALAKLGLVCVDYRVEVECPPDDVSPEPWMHCLATGVALQRRGKDWRVIEHVPTGWCGDGKWRVYSARSTVTTTPMHDDWIKHELSNTTPLGVAKLQRQALAIAIGL